MESNNRRRDSRLTNNNIVRTLEIENDDNSWEVIDFSINGLRIRTKNPPNYKDNQNIKMMVGFRSGKYINVKGVIRRIDFYRGFYEMGLEIAKY